MSQTQTPAASTSTVDQDGLDAHSVRISDTIGIAIIVPLLLIGALIFGLFIMRGTNRFKKQSKSVGDADKDGPYLQHKAELEDEERRKVELEASGERHELNPEDTVHEAGPSEPTVELESEGVKAEMARHGCRQELRGEEHCKELEAV